MPRFPRPPGTLDGRHKHHATLQQYTAQNASALVEPPPPAPSEDRVSRPGRYLVQYVIRPPPREDLLAFSKSDSFYYLYEHGDRLSLAGIAASDCKQWLD